MTSGWADAAPEKNRVFKIINESKMNPVSGRPIGYKLIPQPSVGHQADSFPYATSHYLLPIATHTRPP